MAMPAEQLDLDSQEAEFERLLASQRAPGEQKEALLASVAPFDYRAWVAEAGPAEPDELAEMEEFLQEREAERQWSLAREEPAHLGQPE
jgi:hypothetical protein